MDLRTKLGDWFRVVQLLKTGGGGGTYLFLPFINLGRGHEFPGWEGQKSWKAARHETIKKI